MDIVLGKVGSQTLGKAVTDAAAKPQGSSFQDVLSGADSQLDMQDLTSQLGVDTSDLSSSLGQFNAIPAESVNVDPSHFNVGTTSANGTDKVVDMLSEVNKGQMQMDNMLNEVLYSGKKFSNQELLVMQAQMHHFSEMTELTVKVAEQAVNNLRQIQNTQV
ncbi:MAG: hypothetical protein COV45_07145 [Deltaproteobacteria bacterium CG11_big_fil_rev_8_21_14_0_20_47_16]|nr:MAG: hypothetical protein COV45_07145 [Deltaproteobacteria bacterium CG11_big_fil_rev_8_21_14_0_20_47_16]